MVIDEETKNGKVNHSIHALDTFFSGIESFGKKNFPEKFVIEKITGARLHMYVVDDVNEAYEIVEENEFVHSNTIYVCKFIIKED